MTTFQRKERFLLSDCYEHNQRVVIFCSDLQLEILAQAHQIGADGTFSSCPSIFAQFYIIVAWFKGECIPVAFVLLGGKKEKTYQRMIRELQDACLSRKLDWKPERILLDFEQGAINAFRFFFKDTKIVGCFFHFGQCLWRKLVESGLQSAYAEDEELRNWFAQCVAIVFIPRRYVQDIFADKILDEAPYDKYPELDRFTDYMLSTWIDDDATFHMDIWNHFKNCDTRVNNNNEGYNHRFTRRSGCIPHPNIWSFCEILQREEYLLVQVRYARLVCGESKSRGRLKRDLERDNVLLKAKNLFLQSDRQHDALVDLLQATCKTVQNFE